MANLGLFEINTNSKYLKLTDLTNVEFVDGNNYLMQNYGKPIFVIESVTEPTKGGFMVDNKPFVYQCDGTDLYIKTDGRIYLNIGE